MLFNVGDGIRYSVVEGYLIPAADRPNLHILHSAYVHQVKCSSTSKDQSGRQVEQDPVVRSNRILIGLINLWAKHDTGNWISEKQKKEKKLLVVLWRNF